MPKKTNIHKIMVIGSGPIIIGQAAELIIPVLRRAFLCVKRVMRLF